MFKLMASVRNPIICVSTALNLQDRQQSAKRRGTTKYFDHISKSC